MNYKAEIIDQLYKKFANIIPEIEIPYKADLIVQIQDLKKQRNAIILGHNYMEPAVYYFAADYRGDSLELARIAAKTNADVIVFCGVKFMAETAKILNETKTVLLPSTRAGCSLAASITAEDVRKLKEKYPNIPVVTYVNSYADVKAESDYCCTSGNVAKLVQSLGDTPVLLLPDEFLAKNVANELNRPCVVDDLSSPAPVEIQGLAKHLIISWHGKCEVHEQFSVDDVKKIRQQFPEIEVLAHPECPPEVVNASDFTGSTSKMIQYVKTHQDKKFALLTECSMGDNIISESPRSEILRLCSIRCPHMNQISLENTRDALLNLETIIEVEEPTRSKARLALTRMLEVH